MKSMWVRVIEAHSVPVEDAELQTGARGGKGGVGIRKVRGAGQTSKLHQPHGPAYLEVYTTGSGFGHDRMHHPEPVCFIAQVVNLSDEDFLVLHQAYTWCEKATRGVAYIPWERVSEIRFLSEGDA